MNVATRKEKGTSKGLFYVKKYINELKRKKQPFYVLKCDIKKYFYNIDHKILREKVAKIIPDPDVLNMLDSILSITNTKETKEMIKKVIQQEKERLIRTKNGDWQKKFKELDSIPMYQNGKGLPIGNLSSQILAVFYLNDLDHYIKEVLRCKYYVRYMDDLVIFHENKEYLQYCLSCIEKKLQEVKLTLHEKKAKIFSFNQGLTFLGYRFFLKKERLIITMNPKTKKKITRNIKRVYKKNPKNKKSVLASYKGYFQHCKCGYY